MTREDLAREAAAIFGRQWQTALAASLIHPRTGRPLNPRTVRRWAAGAEIPPFVAGALEDLRRERLRELAGGGAR